MLRHMLRLPSPQTTVVDVSGGLAEVEKCLAAKSTTTSCGSDQWPCLELRAAGSEADGQDWLWLWITQIATIAGSGGPLNTLISQWTAAMQYVCRPHTHVCSHTLMYLLTFAGFAIGLQSESHGAATAHPCGCVFTCPIAATVVDSAGLCG